MNFVGLANPGDQSDIPGDMASLPIQARGVGGEPLTLSVTGLPPGLSFDPVQSVISGQIAPTAGADPYTVTVTASDGTHQASETFQWTVDFSDPATVDQGPQAGSATIDVAANLSSSAAPPAAIQGNVLDYAFHPQGYALTAVLDAAPQNAAAFVLNPNGTFSYTPQTDFVGQDTFAYHVTDGLLGSATVELTLNVTAGPVAHDETYVLAADGSLSASAANGVLANVFNPGQASLSAQLVQGPTGGTLTLQPDGSFSYIPDPAQPPQTALRFTYAVVGGAAPLVAGGAAPVIQAVVTLLPAAAEPTYLVNKVAFTSPLHIFSDSAVERIPQWRAGATRVPVVYVANGVGGTRQGHVEATFSVDANTFAATDKFLVVGVPTIDGFPPIVANGQLVKAAKGDELVAKADFTLPVGPAVLDNLDIQWYVLPPNAALWTAPAPLPAKPTVKDLIAALAATNAALKADPDAPLTNGRLLGPALKDWSGAGTSLQRLYLLYQAPVRLPHLYETLVRLGTQGAADADASRGGKVLTDDDVLRGVMALFMTLKVRPVDENAKDFNGSPLTYWKDWSKDASAQKDTPAAIADGDINCFGWSGLFRATLRTQGLGNTLDVVVAAYNPALTKKGAQKKAEDLFVGPWNAPAGTNNTDPTNPTYLYKNVYDPAKPFVKKGDGTWDYNWSVAGITADENPTNYLHAQGFDPKGQPPLAWFQNHALVVVVLDGRFALFDPSYGILYTQPPLAAGQPAQSNPLLVRDGDLMDILNKGLVAQMDDPAVFPYFGKEVRGAKPTDPVTILIRENPRKNDPTLPSELYVQKFAGRP